MKKILCFALATFLVVLAACSATFKGKAGDNVPLIGGSEIEFSVNIGNSTLKVPPQGDLKEGDCIKVTFLGADGKPIGSKEATVGKDTKAPDGTEDVEFSPCDPKPDKKDKSKSIDDSQIDLRVASGDHLYQQRPFNMADGHGRWIDYTVTASSREEADGIAAHFTANLRHRPRQVEVYTFADSKIRSDGSVRFSILTQDKPLTLAFDWNGIPLYTLRDAHVCQVGSWYVTMVIVPADLVNVPIGGLFDTSNEVHYRLDTATRPQELTFSIETSL